jgi:hypothetical protein
VDEWRAQGALIQHELGREGDRPGRPDERDDPILERLAHHLEGRAAELRPLVEE